MFCCNCNSSCSVLRVKIHHLLLQPPKEKEAGGALRCMPRVQGIVHERDAVLLWSGHKYTDWPTCMLTCLTPACLSAQNLNLAMCRDGVCISIGG